MNAFFLIAAQLVFLPILTPPQEDYMSAIDIENIAEYSTNAGCESSRPTVDAIVTDFGRLLKSAPASKCVEVQKANPVDPSYTLVIKASDAPRNKSARTSDTTTISKIADAASCNAAGNDVESMAVMLHPSVRIETACIAVQ